jgi:hypothetical protein
MLGVLRRFDVGARWLTESNIEFPTGLSVLVRYLVPDENFDCLNQTVG